MFKIGKLLVSKNSRPIIIAEVGQSHLGSVKKVKSIIKDMSKTGVDIIKFQTHLAKHESTLNEPFRIKNKNFKNRIEYWRKMEFSLKEWKSIKKECEKSKLLFLSSPFSNEAVKILQKLQVKAWKIGSGEFFSTDMINKIIKTKKPIIISTGLSKLEEIKKMVDKLKKYKTNFVLMQCTSQYPLKIKEVGMNVLDIYKKKYKCFVGFSDHTGSIYPSIYAMCKGASIIEVHVGDKKEEKNPDSSSSISFEELKQLCKARDEIYTMKSFNIDKKNLSKKLLKIKTIFTKSCALKNFMKKGQIIRKSDITFKKPGNGISQKNINKIIGKKLIKDVFSHNLLKLSDLEK